MAGVTSEILNNMLRSNFNNLKSFAEQLNAELTEEGQEEESRQSHRSNISKILQKFGEAEACFEKGIKCLQSVESDIQQQFTVDNAEEIDQKQLLEEIKGIIQVVEGSGEVVNHEENDLNIDTNIDENRLSQQLDGVKDILDEYHPLRGETEDDDDNGDSEEEDRMCQQLENMQKRAMVKLERSMNEVAENDDDYERRFQQNEALGDSDDEELNIAPDSFERVRQSRGRENNEAEKNMKDELNHMWEEYKKKLNDHIPVDARQVFENKSRSQPDTDFNRLKYFPKYNNPILDLFSKEAVVIVENKVTFTDPITKKAIQNPIRNKICHHIYERDIIYQMLKSKKEMPCPCLGCSCRSFTLKDIVEDEEIAEKITQNQVRQQKEQQRACTSTENFSNDDTEEVHSDDDTQSQSQEIL